MNLIKLAALAGAAAMATPALAVDFTYNPTPGTDILIPPYGMEGQAYPFPVVFNVGNIGTITDVTLTLNGLSHSYAEDLRIWLVGPDGTTVTLLDNAGGSDDFINNNITFSDAASSRVGDNSLSVSANGSYTFKVSDYPSPFQSLSAFDGKSAQGQWGLYIFDDETRCFFILCSSNTGSAQGATLSITATPAVPEPATWGMMIAGFGIAGAAMRRRAAKVSFA